MDDESKKSDKTKRDDGSVVSSGATPTGKTQKDAQPVIPAGVAVAPTPTAHIISAGIVSAVGGEVVLNDKNYKILKVIARSTGEAEVYLVEKEKRRYVFKYYYPAFKPKDTILKQLKGLTHEYIIDLYEYGYYQDRFFEILEYAEGGTIMDINPDGTYRYIPIRDIKRLKQIIKEIVNALEFCHSKGIVHRDIKPENIFFTNPDGTDVQIGDFGISSALDEGLSKHLTGQARTEIYAAPELYQSIGGKTVISKEVDYYALGISLIHIWSGEEPFKDLSPFAIMKIKCDGKVYIPEDMDRDLENLIKGLITVEPSKRWGYNEIQKWLKGEHVPVYYKSVEFKYEPFPFGVEKGEELIANNPVELSDLLFRYPGLGKKHLYKGRIQQWLEKANDALYTLVEKIVEDEYPLDEDAGLIKAAYIIDPTKNYKTFAGVECITPAEIGDAIEQESSYYRSYLTQNKNADLFLYFEARNAKDVADAFRKYAQAYKNNPERAFNTMVLELQGKHEFKINNVRYTSPEALLIADDKTKDKVVQLLKNPDSKLSIWLEQFSDLKNNINKWRKLGRANNITLSYALEEKSPFHFKKDLAYNLEDFRNLFAKYISVKGGLPELLTSNSLFVEEADFWLRHYHNANYSEIVMDYLKKNVSDISKEVLTMCLEYMIETKTFDVIYYQETIKPMIDKEYNQTYKLPIDKKTYDAANTIVERFKQDLIREFDDIKEKVKNLIGELQNFGISPNDPAHIYQAFEDIKVKKTKAISEWNENSLTQMKTSLNLLNNILNVLQNTLMPWMTEERTAREEAQRKKNYARKMADRTIEHSFKRTFLLASGGGILCGIGNSCITFMQSNYEHMNFGNGWWFGVAIGFIGGLIWGIADYNKEYNRYL